ncbi:syntaxin-binding protein 4 isoform X2 [Syngnathoides biaculeatus]|uniref:syntaxin-binding protein 4 isoform X2 n=1 Tax=Syngnathoides biaculeatus TaxID=300417 RepID=UPI002ADDC24E|nr:syntaxin-binding protein 4 isoform X2 [Syngnathoides biaculeatus]
MGPHGVGRAVRRLEFGNCKRGLGVKIIGGYRETTGEDFGVFIKRVVAGGLAALDGRLQPGDLIVDVNNISLSGVTNDRAVEILRTASLSNRMSLLVARDDDSRREFSELMEKYGSAPSAPSGRISPTRQSAGKPPDAAASASESPRPLGPKEGAPVYAHAATPAFSHSVIQLICIAKGSGLGLVVKGGANRAEGPMVFIRDIAAGGDCQKDGRLQVGDQLVSVNKESLIGVTYEEARTILARTKLRPDPTVEVAFIRRRTSSGSSSGPRSPVVGGPRGGPPPVPVTELASGRIGQQAQASAAEPEPEPDPDVDGGSCHLKLEQIEKALDLLGLKPSDARRQAFRSRLRADPAGTVTRADLESASREAFGPRPDEAAAARAGSKFTCDDLLSLLEVPACSPSTSARDDVERLRKANAEALAEIKRLQDQLSECRGVRQQMAEELDVVKLEAKAAAEETRTLRARVQLAQEARKQACGMEMDYEEAVRLLEAEIAELKAHRAREAPPPPPPLPDHKEESERLEKKAAVLESQLRKSDAAKKTLAMSTAKLLAFVQNVQEYLLEGLGPTKSFSCVTAEGVPQGGPSRHEKSSWTAAALAKRADELSASVRNVLEVDACRPSSRPPRL